MSPRVTLPSAEDQIVEWSRVGDNNPHLASKAQAPQGRALTLEVFPSVIQPHFMRLQEAVESVASLQADRLTQLRIRQLPSLVLFQRRCSQTAAAQVATLGDEALGAIVRSALHVF